MNEEERVEIERRCNEAIGAKESIVLTKVLSYFWEEAELFIHTQDHAASIKGCRSIWFTVRHKTDGYGLNKRTLHRAGQMEYLGVYGFTGERPLQLITEVNVMRGIEKGHNRDMINTILRVAKSIPSFHGVACGVMKDCGGHRELDRHGEMVAKILEVMAVTPHEIRLLRAFLKMLKETDELIEEKNRLKERIETLIKVTNLVFPATDFGEPPETRWQKFCQAVEERDMSIPFTADCSKFIETVTKLLISG